MGIGVGGELFRRLDKPVLVQLRMFFLETEHIILSQPLVRGVLKESSYSLE